MSKKVADSTAQDKDVPMKEITPLANTLDAAIVSLAQLEWSMKWNSRMGLVVPILLHVASQTIQFVVLYYFYMFSLESLEDPFENKQFNFMNASIHAAMATNTPLSKLTPALIAQNATIWPAGHSNMKFYTTVHKICGIDTSNLLINGLALFLFAGSVLRDMHGIFGSLYVLLNLESDGEGPALADDDGDIDITKPGAKNLITTMATPMKVVAVVFILLPHLLCHVAIAIAGSKYISLGTAPFTVLKAMLKIWFIAKFDAELYKGLTADNFTKFMKVTKYSIKKEKPGGLVELWSSYFGTVVKIFIAVMWAWLCLFVIFKNLTHYRDACDGYYNFFQISGYGHKIPYEPCIYGNLINPATATNFKETCGGAGGL